jgi:hypothetical protein
MKTKFKGIISDFSHSALGSCDPTTIKVHLITPALDVETRNIIVNAMLKNEKITITIKGKK